MQRAVDQVLGEVVAQEVADREARHDEPAGESERRIRPPADQACAGPVKSAVATAIRPTSLGAITIISAWLTANIL